MGEESKEEIIPGQLSGLFPYRLRRGPYNAGEQVSGQFGLLFQTGVGGTVSTHPSRVGGNLGGQKTVKKGKPQTLLSEKSRREL